MSASNVIILVLYAFGMAVGQVLFKLSADRTSSMAGDGFVKGLLGNGYFLSAVVIYGALTVLWVWILTRIPLSRAYPFVALAFVFTPALAFLLFGESPNSWYFLGLGLILLGLGVVVWKAG